MSGIGSPELHRSLGLSDEEMDEIRKILGRDPTTTELAMYSVMWSEHCSYKSSRIHLSKLPSHAPWVVVGPGENAGVVDLGDGIVAALRIESHNHPSAVEPFQGAATGVGGIIRDVLSMGARPILLGDPLRFGPLVAGPTPEGEVTESDAKRNRYLLEQVVAGISHYGNAVGVPTIGGELGLAPCYSGNPLVNVFCLGIAYKDRIQRAKATNPGDAVILLGASTGRDGIGGVSVLASAGFDEDSKRKRPSVQVGDPFEEKKLIEACLEIFSQGLATAIQDLGGAGISCAASETAARGRTGVEIDVQAVHRREPGMRPEEVMISESQERMFVTVSPPDVDKVLKIAEKWGLQASVIGKVVRGSQLVVRDGDIVVASVPAQSLADGPKLHRPSKRPERLDALQANTVSSVTQIPSDSEALMAIISDPASGDKSWIWRQYDHQLFLNTVSGPGSSEATVVRARIPDDVPITRYLSAENIAETERSDQNFSPHSRAGNTRGVSYSITGGVPENARLVENQVLRRTYKGIVLAFEGGGRFSDLDPRAGAKLVVAEAARKVACVGGKPIALVDCLNFGNPEHPEVMWQFEETVEGMAQACSSLGVPVVGGNVSFYNETAGRDIWPTPIVAVLGSIDVLDRRPPGIAFFESGLVIAMIGRQTQADLDGSAYAWSALNHHGGMPPALDLEEEKRLQAALQQIVSTSNSQAKQEGRGALESVVTVCQVASGGLAKGLARSCVLGHIGAKIDLSPLVDEIADTPLPPVTVALFSETPTRALIACRQEHFEAVADIAAEHALGCWMLGRTGGDSLEIRCAALPNEPVLEVLLGRLEKAWMDSLPSSLGSTPHLSSSS